MIGNMKKYTLRLAAYGLGLAAMFLLLCEPVEWSLHWMRDLVLSKIFAVAAGYGAWLAYKLSEEHKKS